MKNKIYLFLTAPLLFFPLISRAEEATDSKVLDSIRTIGGIAYPGSENPDIKIVIANIIQAALGLVGTIFIVLIIWAGFRWMTSGGNEKSIESAKGTLQSSIIGLVIVMAGYAIAYSITLWLSGAVSDVPAH